METNLQNGFVSVSHQIITGAIAPFEIHQTKGEESGAKLVFDFLDDGKGTI